MSECRLTVPSVKAKTVPFFGVRTNTFTSPGRVKFAPEGAILRVGGLTASNSSFMAIFGYLLYSCNGNAHVHA